MLIALLLLIRDESLLEVLPPPVTEDVDDDEEDVDAEFAFRILRICSKTVLTFLTVSGAGISSAMIQVREVLNPLVTAEESIPKVEMPVPTLRDLRRVVQPDLDG